MSSQDTAAPKRRSAAANRRRKRRSDATASQGAIGQSAAVDDLEVGANGADAADVQKSTRAERKATARVGTEPAAEPTLPQEKHLRRKQERREAKSQQPEKRSGLGRMMNTQRFSGVQGFYQATVSEIRKVEWPDREATRNLTILVIALSTVLGLMLGGIDYALFQLFEVMS